MQGIRKEYARNPQGIQATTQGIRKEYANSPDYWAYTVFKSLSVEPSGRLESPSNQRKPRRKPTRKPIGRRRKPNPVGSQGKTRLFQAKSQAVPVYFDLRCAPRVKPPRSANQRANQLATGANQSANQRANQFSYSLPPAPGRELRGQDGVAWPSC
jgi:hypothetical protein